MNQSISDEGVCRTAPATLGLLIMMCNESVTEEFKVFLPKQDYYNFWESLNGFSF